MTQQATNQISIFYSTLGSGMLAHLPSDYMTEQTWNNFSPASYNQPFYQLVPNLPPYGDVGSNPPHMILCIEQLMVMIENKTHYFK